MQPRQRNCGSSPVPVLSSISLQLHCFFMSIVVGVHADDP